MLIPLPELPPAQPAGLNIPQWMERITRHGEANAQMRAIANPSPKKREKPEPPEIEPEGLLIKEAAIWLGVDRRKLAESLVEVPPGPVRGLRPGQVPARRIGNQLRIFKDDLMGREANDDKRDEYQNEAEQEEPQHLPDEDSGSEHGFASWRGQITRLRDRYALGG